MDKILIALLVLAVLLGAVCGTFYLLNEKNANEMMEFIDTYSAQEVEPRLRPQADSEGNWYFITDEDFKVLHLTDIHLSGGILQKDTDKMTINTVAAMVYAEKPDLVIVTGDIAYAIGIGGTINNAYAHNMFVHLMETLGVYWTVAFGNHDTEPYNYHTREAVADIYASANDKCLFVHSPNGVSGEGNHIINIKNSAGEVTKSLFVLDSHSYMRQGLIGGLIDSLAWNYDYIKDDQIDWYKSMIEQYNPKSSLMFFHIPLVEVKTAYDKYIENGRKLGDGVNSFTGVDGETGAVVFPSDKPSNLFDTVKAIGNTKGIFFGHDHFNNFVMDYEGVIFSYGYSVDYIAYGNIGSKGAQRGCTVLTITPDGEFDESNISHENYYQDKYQPLNEKDALDANS